MRAVTITKREFDLFLWRAFASQGPSSPAQQDTVVSLVKKLKAVSSETDPGAGDRVPSRELVGPDTVLELEAEEHKLLKALLEKWTVRVANAVQDEYAELRAKLDGPRASQ